MKAEQEAYSLLRRLTVAFTIVASVVLSLAGGLLYHSLSLQLRQRDDSEISVKLDEFLREARTFGSAQAVAGSGKLFQEELLTHPAITFAIVDARGNLGEPRLVHDEFADKVHEPVELGGGHADGRIPGQRFARRVGICGGRGFDRIRF